MFFHRSLRYYLIIKGKDFATLLHKDIHDSPHYVLYVQVKGSAVFIGAPPIKSAWLMGWLSLKEECEDEEKKKVNDVILKKIKSFVRTAKDSVLLKEGKVLLVSPECGHQVHTLSDSIVLAYELQLNRKNIKEVWKDLERVGKHKEGKRFFKNCWIGSKRRYAPTANGIRHDLPVEEEEDDDDDDVEEEEE